MGVKRTKIPDQQVKLSNKNILNAELNLLFQHMVKSEINYNKCSKVRRHEKAHIS